jgi:hypothetical protein
VVPPPFALANGGGGPPFAVEGAAACAMLGIDSPPPSCAACASQSTSPVSHPLTGEEPTALAAAPLLTYRKLRHMEKPQ